MSYHDFEALALKLAAEARNGNVFYGDGGIIIIFDTKVELEETIANLAHDSVPKETCDVFIAKHKEMVKRCAESKSRILFLFSDK